MSNCLYALIPYEGEIKPDSPEECYENFPFIPELQGVPSKLAKRTRLYLFPGFLLINTCYSMYMILPDENGPSPSRLELFKIVQALGASEAWYLEEVCAELMFGYDTYSFDRFKVQIEGEEKAYLIEYTPELTDIAGYIHDDFKDLKGTGKELIWKYVSTIDIETIHRVESEHGITLPASLRQTIVNWNNGTPCRYLFDSESEDEHVFKTLLSYDERDMENVFLALETLHKSGDEDLFPFGNDPAGNLICLENGPVVLWNHETGKRDRVAGSADKFFVALYDPDCRKRTSRRGSFGTDYEQFVKANWKVLENYRSDSDYRKQFDAELERFAEKDSSVCTRFKSFLQEPALGSAPYGFVWHHSEQPGLLQLVYYKHHALTPHSSGSVTWGSNSGCQEDEGLESDTEKDTVTGNGISECCGSLTWKYVSPVTEEQIEEVQRMFSIKLPDDLKSLLLTSNNGVPSLDRLDTVTGKTCWFGHLLSYRKDNIWNIYDAAAVFDEEGMDELFPIATDSEYNFICLEKESGQIVFWDREEESVDALADSVTGLLRMLVSDGADLTWEDVSPVSAEQIEEAEHLLNIKLPYDLKILLLRANNGVPSMDRVDTLTGKSFRFGRLLSYRKTDALNIYDAAAFFNEEEMDEFFPIASDSEHNYICLEKESGLIVVWDRKERTVEDLAVSVDALIGRLRPYTTKKII